MADSGIFRINPLQGWQRDAILKAAQLIRDRFGNPPIDPLAKSAHDALLEVLDPARAFLASRIILRAIQGKSDKDDVHFSFARNL